MAFLRIAIVIVSYFNYNGSADDLLRPKMNKGEILEYVLRKISETDFSLISYNNYSVGNN